MNRIKISPIGNFFEVDEGGYIINPASLDKIQPEYKEVLFDVIDLY